MSTTSRQSVVTYLIFTIVSLFLISSQVAKSIDEIKIGVLIKHRGLEEPLNRTLEMLNADTSVLFSKKLVAIVEIIESDNSYQASTTSKYKDVVSI